MPPMTDTSVAPIRMPTASLMRKRVPRTSKATMKPDVDGEPAQPRHGRGVYLAEAGLVDEAITPGDAAHHRRRQHHPDQGGDDDQNVELLQRLPWSAYPPRCA